MTELIGVLLATLRVVLRRLRHLPSAELAQIIEPWTNQVIRDIDATTVELDAGDLLECARLLNDLGRADTVRALLTSMLAVLQPTDELAIRVRNRQAVLAAARGDYAEARDSLEEAYIDAGRTGSPMIEPVLANLAVVSLLAGDTAEADRRTGDNPPVELIAAAVRTEITRLASDHDSLAARAAAQHAVTADYLAAADSDDRVALAAFGATMAAEFDAAVHARSRERVEYAVDALEIAERRSAATLGSSHPQSLVASANLALARFQRCLDDNDPGAGRRAVDRMLANHERMRTVLGDDHPRSLSTESNVVSAEFELARMRRSVDQARTALARMASVSDRMFAVLGPTHPQALLTLSNLASAQLDVARAHGLREDAVLAMETLETAAARSTAVLGGAHPATRVLDEELRACSRLISDLDEPGGGTLLTRQRTIVGSAFDEEYMPFNEAGAALEQVATEPPDAVEVFSIFDPAQRLVDEDVLVRPYYWAGGRTRPDYSLDLHTLVSATDVRRSIDDLEIDHVRILGLCRQPISVAEVTAYLALPLSEVRILLGDLASVEMIRIHISPTGSDDGPSLDVLRRVLDGLRKL